ncbi:hypothetical protein [Clostridium butyricum]|uniref:hypothetical protein n=1 Tax=Clostridium butyricum TaxID=1492 RepID=UPI002ABDBF86|nr:hypothetical protein [Clostridium butyricum]
MSNIYDSFEFQRKLLANQSKIFESIQPIVNINQNLITNIQPYINIQEMVNATLQPALEIINKNITKFNYDIFTKQLELFNNINLNYSDQIQNALSSLNSLKNSSVNFESINLKNSINDFSEYIVEHPFEINTESNLTIDTDTISEIEQTFADIPTYMETQLESTNKTDWIPILSFIIALLALLLQIKDSFKPNDSEEQIIKLLNDINTSISQINDSSN